MRTRTAVATVSAAVLALGLASTAPALATGETFGCHVAPNADTTYRGACGPDRPASRYTVSFQFTGTGTYSYVWTLTGNLGGKTVVGGCTATSSFCDIQVPNGGDRLIYGQIAATQAGTTITRTATASIPAVCGSVWC